MNYNALKTQLDPQYRSLSKAEFIAVCKETSDPKVRVGGPKGKGRITVKVALILLGVRDR